MKNDGMKRWLPFASLVEQNEFLEKMIYEKNKIKKPKISVEQARKIDNILHEYKDIPLNFKIYFDGYLYTFRAQIQKIDMNNHRIIFKDFSIPIKNIIDIDSPSDFEDIC